MASDVRMKKLTPVLIVDAIEPCLSFWTEQLGFEKTVEVPEGSALGFVILTKDDVEIMYQSRASVRKDIPSLAELPWSSTLYIEVAELDPVIGQLEGAEIVVSRRKTSYGADEIFVREPGGNIIGFAAH